MAWHIRHNSLPFPSPEFQCQKQASKSPPRDERQLKDGSRVGSSGRVVTFDFLITRLEHEGGRNSSPGAEVSFEVSLASSCAELFFPNRSALKKTKSKSLASNLFAVSFFKAADSTFILPFLSFLLSAFPSRQHVPIKLCPTLSGDLDASRSITTTHHCQRFNPTPPPSIETSKDPRNPKPSQTRQLGPEQTQPELSLAIL